MGSSEEGKSSKSDKSSPPVTEQTNVHVYPDWMAMQAYYGPRVALPPYFNSAAASGHPPPPYMWGPPQPMMPHYGAPYAAIYTHGGLYAHPGVPLGSIPHGQGVSSPAVSEALAGTPLSIDTPAKSPGNTNKGLIKKLKGFDGLAMSIGNGTADKAEVGADNRPSQSAETGGSSDGSDGNTEEADQNKRKRSREGTPTNGEAVEDEKNESEAIVLATEKVLGVPVTPVKAAGQVLGTTVAPTMATAIEVRKPGVNVKGNSVTVVSPPNAALSSENWLQNERELKRERRKQSNRESARRSRLRKQAEIEDLARRVESLTAENMALKSEINQLVENSQKLRLENTKLLEKMKSENGSTKVDVKRNPTDSTENLLSKVDNSSSVGRISEEGGDGYEKRGKSGSKLHQLLDANPRADAVAAG